MLNVYVRVCVCVCVSVCVCERNPEAEKTYWVGRVGWAVRKKGVCVCVCVCVSA